MIYYAYAVKNGRELKVRTKIILALIPIPIFLLIMTNQYHGFFRQALRVSFNDNLTLVDTSNNFLFYVMVVYVYTMVFIALLNFISTFKMQPLKFRDREIQLIVAITIPIAFNLFYQISNLLFSYDFDPTPIGYFICICIFYYHFLVKKNNASKLLVRGYMMDYMNDGLLYLNHHQNISDANYAFLKIANSTLEDIYDKPISAIENELFRVLNELLNSPETYSEYKTSLQNEALYYRITYRHILHIYRCHGFEKHLNKIRICKHP